MKQPTAAEVLENVRIGEDDARLDNPMHDRFVSISIFKDFIDDQVDLVMGRKGSGKSAIFRYVTESNELDLPRTTLVPLDFIGIDNTFLRILESTGGNQDLLRRAWLAYFVAISSREMLHGSLKGAPIRGVPWRTAQDSSIQEPLKAVIPHLKRARIVADRDIDEGSYVKRLTEALRRLRIKAKPEPDGSFSFEMGIGAETEDPDEALINLDLRTVFGHLVDALEADDRRLWLLIDGLDEVFSESEDLERVGLRSLLRAHIDLIQLGRGRIRTKLFLRDDVLERVTDVEGFRGATALRRQQIDWSKSDIENLIARRVVGERAYRSAYGVSMSDLGPTTAHELIVGRLLPKRVSGMDPIEWILDECKDGTGGHNPRTVITLLNLARNREREDPRSTNRRVPHGELISEGSLTGVLLALSKKRFDDTVLAECRLARTPNLRALLQRLERKNAEFDSRAELASALDLSPDSVEADTLIEDLLLLGVLGRRGDQYYIAPVYRRRLRSRVVTTSRA